MRRLGAAFARAEGLGGRGAHGRGGNPSRVIAAKDVPIWAFHGAKDETVPLERTAELVAALRAANGQPIFTVYPNGTHDDAKYRALHEPSFLTWMFAQRRASPVVSVQRIAEPTTSE